MDSIAPTYLLVGYSEGLDRGARDRAAGGRSFTKMRDARTHLAHKAEHAVYLETGAIVGVTEDDADGEQQGQVNRSTIAEVHAFVIVVAIVVFV